MASKKITSYTAATVRRFIKVDLKLPVHQLKGFVKHFAFNEPPQDPPCAGGRWIPWGTRTVCVEHVVHYIDTVVWVCPDGTRKTVTSDTATDPKVPC